jgi:hypothetical protein
MNDISTILDGGSPAIIAVKIGPHKTEFLRNITMTMGSKFVTYRIALTDVPQAAPKLIPLLEQLQSDVASKKSANACHQNSQISRAVWG